PEQDQKGTQRPVRPRPWPGVRSGWSLEPSSNGRPRKMIVASIRGRAAPAVRDTTGRTEPGLWQTFRLTYEQDRQTRKAKAFAGFSLYAQHGRHLYGESPEWGLASAYH